MYKYLKIYTYFKIRFPWLAKSHLRCKWVSFPNLLLSSTSYLFHSKSSLDLTGHSINSSCHAQIIQRFIFLPDGILCINSGDIKILLLDCLKKKKNFRKTKRKQQSKKCFIKISGSICFFLIRVKGWLSKNLNILFESIRCEWSC